MTAGHQSIIFEHTQRFSNHGTRNAEHLTQLRFRGELTSGPKGTARNSLTKLLLSDFC
jgi:hypothetical protein